MESRPTQPGGPKASSEVRTTRGTPQDILRARTPGPQPSRRTSKVKDSRPRERKGKSNAFALDTVGKEEEDDKDGGASLAQEHQTQQQQAPLSARRRHSRFYLPLTLTLAEDEYGHLSRLSPYDDGKLICSGHHLRRLLAVVPGF